MQRNRRANAWAGVRRLVIGALWPFATLAAPGIDADWRDRFALGAFADTMQDPVRASRDAREALDRVMTSADPRQRLRAAARFFLAMDETTGQCALVDPLIREARAGGPALAAELFDVAVGAYLSISDQHCQSFLSPDELAALARQLGDPGRMYFVHGVRALALLKANRFNDALLALSEQRDAALSDAQIAFALHTRAQAELAANPTSNTARAALEEAQRHIDPRQYPALHLSQLVLSFRMELAARREAAAFAFMQQALPGTRAGLLGACPSGYDLVTFARALVTAGRPAEAVSLLEDARRFHTGCKKLVALRGRTALEVYTALGTADAFARGQREIEQLDALLSDTRSFGPQPVRAFKLRASAFWEKFGDPAKALRALKEANQAGEALQKISSETARVELQERLNVAAKDKENAQLKAEAALQEARQRGWITAFVVALLGVAGTGTALSLAVRRGRRLTQVSAELQARNAELEQRSATRIQLLAAACHDLRQPAHALGMLAELGDEAQTHPARFDAWLQSVRRSTASLADMLDALMDLGRLDGGHYTPLLGDVSLAELMHDLTLHFDSLARRKGLRLDVPPGEGEVVSDRHLLRRILFNLVSNAIKYTDTGFVRVTLAPAGDAVRVTVQDSGPGIPPDKVDEVFRDHVRLNPAKAAEGLGIGLSIVRRGAQLLGHDLRLTSPPEGGTAVSVTLKRSLRTRQAAAPLAEAADASVGSGIVALLEDDPDVREAMAALLRRRGYTVHAAAQAQPLAAAFQASHTQPALVITDLHLGATNGLDELAQLRQALQSPDLPALLVTGDLDRSVTARAAQARVHVAHKPLAPGKLFNLLQRLMPATASAAAAGNA